MWTPQAFETLYASPHAPPPCPSDLNLAQYTKLLFDKRCMVSLLSLPLSPVFPIAHIPFLSLVVISGMQFATWYACYMAL